MKSLEDFISKNEPKRRKSKLNQLKNEINQLYQKDYRVEQILEFLKENKIKTSKRNLYKFLEKHKNDHRVSGVAIKNSITQKVETNEESESEKEQKIRNKRWIEQTIAKAKGEI